MMKIKIMGMGVLILISGSMLAMWGKGVSRVTTSRAPCLSACLRERILTRLQSQDYNDISLRGFHSSVSERGILLAKYMPFLCGPAQYNDALEEILIEVQRIRPTVRPAFEHCEKNEERIFELMERNLDSVDCYLMKSRYRRKKTDLFLKKIDDAESQDEFDRLQYEFGWFLPASDDKIPLLIKKLGIYHVYFERETQEEKRKNFRDLVLRCHDDKYRDKFREIYERSFHDEETNKKLEALFKEIKPFHRKSWNWFVEKIENRYKEGVKYRAFKVASSYSSLMDRIHKAKNYEELRSLLQEVRAFCENPAFKDFYSDLKEKMIHSYECKKESINFAQKNPRYFELLEKLKMATNQDELARYAKEAEDYAEKHISGDRLEREKEKIKKILHDRKKSEQDELFTNINVSQDPYTVLQISRNAIKQEIRNAYLRLSKIFHPDKNHDPRATDAFRKVQESYEKLK